MLIPLAVAVTFMVGMTVLLMSVLIRVVEHPH